MNRPSGCETLRTNYRVQESRSQLENIAAAHPARIRRRVVAWTSLEDADAAVASHDPFCDPRAVERAEAVMRALTSALHSLSAEDRLLIRLRFEDGLRIVDIAHRFHEAEKPLYRRLERVLAQLRRELGNRGLHRVSVSELLDGPGAAATDGALRSAFEDGPRASYSGTSRTHAEGFPGRYHSSNVEK